ncbi:MAG TPA: flagellar basal-body rod protein FlgF [Negativicutes bacterium]|nr:flagellar basal-body rod protein FlgF [Negativicutes bacterium]
MKRGVFLIRGIYIAASGMLVESLRADVTANNLANVNTAGFKKDFAVMKDYASRQIKRINDGEQTPEIGTMGAGAWIDTIATSYSTGIVRNTNNSLDFALEGKGFFTIETPAGVRYTRNGTFTRSGNGDLVTQDGNRVLGLTGPINLSGTGQAGKVTVAEDGRLFLDGVENNTFMLNGFEDETRLRKEGSSLFRPPEGVQAQQVNPIVRQGYLELSNVNVISEMVNMIAGFRAYETNSKVVQTHDTLLDKAVNEVARV